MLALFGMLAMVITFASFTAKTQAAAGIYKTINFQGKVVNTNGTNVADASYTFKFRIYTSASADTATPCANTCAWEESKSLTTVNGIFQTNLGDTTTLPGSVNFNTDTLYIAVIFNSDTEMAPRIRLTSVPYAFNADMLDGLDSSALVQLSPAGGQQSGSINVSGGITSGGTVSTNTVDASSSGALTLGSTNATGLTLAKNTTLGSGLTLSLQGNNALNLGSTTAAGGIIFKDGTANNRTVTISTVGLTASYALNLPSTAAVGGGQCLQTATGSTVNLTFGSCTGATGGFVTLQAGTPGTADSGNINITGVGIAASFYASTFDTATGVLMNIGTGNATSITIGKATVTTTVGGALNTQDITLAANKSLTFTAGNGTFDQSASTGTFKSSVGANTLGGDTTVASNKTFTASGSALFKDATNSTTAFQVQNAAGNSLFTADTTNMAINVNNGVLNVNGLSAPAAPAIALASGGTLAYSTTYQYRLAATNAAGRTNAVNSSPTSVTTAGSGTTRTVNVTWSAVTGATGYYLYRSTDGGVTWYRNTIAGGATVSAADNGTNFTWSGTDYSSDNIRNLTNQITLQQGGMMNFDTSANAFIGEAATSGVLNIINTNDISFQSNTGINWGSRSSGANWMSLSSTGAALFSNTTNSATAFQVQNAAGRSVLALDTTGAKMTLGNITATAAQGVAGSVVLADGTNDNFGATLNTATLTASRTISLPDAAGTVCLQSAAACGFATGTAASYIQNQNAGAQTTSNFWISGTGIATTLQAGTIDTPSGTTTLAIGTTNASAGINLNQSTSLAASKNFTFTSGAGNFDQSSSTGTNSTGTGAVSLNGNTTVASGKTLTVGGDTTIKSTSATAFQIQNTAGTATLFSFDSSAGNITIGSGASRTLAIAAAAAAAAGNDLNIKAGASGTGAVNGGNLVLSGGVSGGSGVQGLVNLASTAFGASSLQTNSITAGLVDQYSSIPVTANTTNVTISVPVPINTVTGRILYITAVNGSTDFTLLLGGSSINIAMKQNSTATLIWNGTGWTAAGASSSTDLQSAYNNTLTSAGGAEIILNAAGGNADGFTIRNNAATPIIGPLLEVQSSIGTNILSVNNNATELAANGGAETSSSFATAWTAVGAPTISRNTTLADVATGQASAQVSSTAAVNTGVRNNLAANLAVSSTYQVSFTGLLSSGTFSTLDVEYSRDGGTTLAPCTLYSTNTLVTTGWSKVTCTITTDSTTATNPDLIIRQTDATARIFWIDNLSVTILTATSTPQNVQIGGGLYGGAATVLTLDRASSAPVVNGNTALLGSMYYDTTSGRIQCYEADGWGACGSSPNNYVNLVPEFPGAVLDGSGVGTLTADFCASQTGILSINTALCSTGQALNYYKWTSPQASQQTYSIYVTYQLPAAFKQFESNTSVQLTARTDNTTNGVVSYEMFRSESGTLSACGTETTVTSTANTWQTVGINGSELTGCGFSTASANNFAIFKINVKANSNANVYVGTLSFTTIGQ